MNTERDFTEKRFYEFAERAKHRNVPVYTAFLTEAEQALLLSLERKLGVPLVLFGGMENAERRLARFGEAEEAEPWPIVCLSVLPKNARFSDEPAHRDFLGAMMHLGVERETIGDIFLAEGGAYVFCTETAARLAEELLLTVRKTTVEVQRCVPPKALLEPVVSEELVRVTNERADAVVAHLYGLSREKAHELFRRELVFRNGCVLSNESAVLKENDLVSVRGFGRFRFLGVEGLTKKGKKNVRVAVYGAR